MASAQELERLVIKLVGDGTHYAQTLKEAVKQTETAAQRIERIGKKTGAALDRMAAGIRNVGRQMTVAITVPAVTFAAASVKSFASFDQAMTQSTSIMRGLTNKEMEEMRMKALELGKSSVQGPTELAQAYFYLASAGLDAKQSMAALPAVTDFATAGAFDMSRATDLLTDAQSALGLTTKDATQNLANMTRVSDTLVMANTLANASVEQFSTSLTSKAGASLKVFNKDVEEGVAVLAAYADQGVKAELSGNALDRMLRLLAKSSMDNADVHKRLKFEVFDASGEMNNMADIIANLEDVLKGMSTEQKVATLDMLGFEARVQQVILPLIGTSDAIRQYEKELRKASGTTKDVAMKQLKSLTNQLKITWNQFKVLLIGIGAKLAPVVEYLNERLRVAIAFWEGLSESVQRTVIYIVAAAAAIGPVLLIIASLVAKLGLMFTLVGAFASIGLPAFLLFLKMAAVITVLATGIVLAVAAFVMLTKKFIDYPGLIKGMLTATWDFAQAVVGFFVNIQENVGILTAWIADNWMNVLERIPAALLEIVGNMVVALVNNFRVGMRVTAQLIGVGLQVIVKLFLAAWKWIFDGSMLKSASTAFTKLLAMAQKVGWELIKALSGQSIEDSFLESFRNSKTPIAEQLGKIIADGVKDLDVPSLIPTKAFSDLQGPAFNLAIMDDPAVKALDTVADKIDDVAASTDGAADAADKALVHYKAWQLAIAGTDQFDTSIQGLQFGVGGRGRAQFGTPDPNAGPAQASMPKTGIEQAQLSMQEKMAAALQMLVDMQENESTSAIQTSSSEDA